VRRDQFIVPVESKVGSGSSLTDPGSGVTNDVFTDDSAEPSRPINRAICQAARPRARRIFVIAFGFDLPDALARQRQPVTRLHERDSRDRVSPAPARRRGRAVIA
jgi:hypothetical protein